MLHRFAITRPKTTLLMAVGATLALAPGAYWLRIQTDGNALLPHIRPEIAVDRQIRDEFGILDQIVVILRNDGPEGIFNGHTLTLVDTLTGAFRAIPSIDLDQVLSLSTEKNHRVFQGTLRNRTFLERSPLPPVTWDGGGADDKWTTPENWSTDAVPAPFDNVTFVGNRTAKDRNSKNCVVASDCEITNLTIAAGYKGAITFRGGRVSIHGDLVIQDGTVGSESATVGVQGKTRIEAGSVNWQQGEVAFIGDVVQKGGKVEWGDAGGLRYFFGNFSREGGTAANSSGTFVFACAVGQSFEPGPDGLTLQGLDVREPAGSKLDISGSVKVRGRLDIRDGGETNVFGTVTLLPESVIHVSDARAVVNVTAGGILDARQASEYVELRTIRQNDGGKVLRPATGPATESQPEHSNSPVSTSRSSPENAPTGEALIEAWRKAPPVRPWTQAELDEIRNDLRRIQLYTGTFVSYDEKSTAILIGVPGKCDRPQLYRQIQETIDALGETPEEIYVVGAPVAESLMGTHILEDLGVPEWVLGHRLKRDSIDLPVRFPRSMHELRLQIGRHIGLVPIALAVMASVFLIAFRSPIAAALPLIEVGACLAATFGFMGYIGIPVYLTIAVAPVLLSAVGIADEIHVFMRYRQNLRQEIALGGALPSTVASRPILMETMNEMWVPILKTSVTTAIGFFSFLFSSLEPVRMFGLVTGFGTLFCMVWSMTAIPASLALVHPRRLVGRPSAAVASGTVALGLFGQLGRFVLRARVPLLLLMAAVVAVAPLGVLKVPVQDSWIDGFAPESRFRRATTLVNDQFRGTHILHVCVDTSGIIASGDLDEKDIDLHEATIPAGIAADPKALIGQWISIHTHDAPLEPTTAPASQTALAQRIRIDRLAMIEDVQPDGDRWKVRTSKEYGFLKPPKIPGIKEAYSFKIGPRRMLMPEMLSRIKGLETFIDQRSALAVGGVIGLTDYVTTTNFMIDIKDDLRRNIPENPERVLWLLQQYRRVRGEQRYREMVSVDHDRALITVFMKKANFRDTGRLLREIREYAANELEPQGITVSFAGDVAVSQTMIQAIVDTQIRSLLLSLLGVWALAAVLGRSVLWGLYCVLPCSVAVLVNFAVMGWLGIPLGVATSMFSAMTLGIGVDYAIHLTERYRSAANAGKSSRDRLLDAVSTTGPAILVDAAAISLGFGVLVLSQVPPNARLGALFDLSVVNCFFATFALLPAMLSFRREK